MYVCTIYDIDNFDTTKKLKDNIWGLCLYFVQLLIHYKERERESEILRLIICSYCDLSTFAFIRFSKPILRMSSKSCV